MRIMIPYIHTSRTSVCMYSTYCTRMHTRVRSFSVDRFAKRLDHPGTGGGGFGSISSSVGLGLKRRQLHISNLVFFLDLRPSSFVKKKKAERREMQANTDAQRIRSLQN